MELDLEYKQASSRICAFYAASLLYQGNEKLDLDYQSSIIHQIPTVYQGEEFPEGLEE